MAIRRSIRSIRGGPRCRSRCTLPNTPRAGRAVSDCRGRVAPSSSRPTWHTDSTSQLLSRLEFDAYDLNGDADSTNPGEGFVKFYQVDDGAKAARAAAGRRDWTRRAARLRRVSAISARASVASTTTTTAASGAMCRMTTAIWSGSSSRSPCTTARGTRPSSGSAVGGSVPPAISAANAHRK